MVNENKTKWTLVLDDKRGCKNGLRIVRFVHTPWGEVAARMELCGHPECAAEEAINV